MNDTVQELYRRQQDQHHAMLTSNNAATGVDEKIVEFRIQQMHTDDRVTRLEVRVSSQPAHPAFHCKKKKKKNNNNNNNKTQTHKKNNFLSLSFSC